MTERNTILLKDAVARNPLVRLDAPASVAFGADEQIALIGPNGAGKSLLVDMLTGKYPLREGSLTYDFHPSTSTSAYENIRYIATRQSLHRARCRYTRLAYRPADAHRITGYAATGSGTFDAR